MEIELAAKISKHEIKSILPDMELYEQKVKTIIEETVEENLQKIEEKFVMIDKRIGRVKNEFDMNSLQKLISSKASQEKVTHDWQNHEHKMVTLDKNQLAMATDFATFQQAINQMHGVLMGIQEQS